MSTNVDQYFSYEHLPEHLQSVAKACYELFEKMSEELPDSSEKSTGMRKLLEAKDCFVRAKISSAASSAN